MQNNYDVAARVPDEDTNQVGKSVANILRMLIVVTSFLNKKLSFLFRIGNISHKQMIMSIEVRQQNYRNL